MLGRAAIDGNIKSIVDKLNRIGGYRTFLAIDGLADSPLYRYALTSGYAGVHDGSSTGIFSGHNEIVIRIAAIYKLARLSWGSLLPLARYDVGDGIGGVESAFTITDRIGGEACSSLALHVSEAEHVGCGAGGRHGLHNGLTVVIKYRLVVGAHLGAGRHLGNSPLDVHAILGDAIYYGT